MRHREVFRGQTVCSKDVSDALHPFWWLVNIDIPNAWNVKVLSSYSWLIAEPKLGNFTSTIVRV
jgi:hypothetical protein